MRVLTSAQMREADRVTIEERGIPGLTLMENAGHQVVAAMRAACGDLRGLRVATVSGRGNNGGDGLVVARLLIDEGVSVDALLIAKAGEVRGDARRNLDRLQAICGVTEITNDASWESARDRALARADVVVDALVGTGLNNPLSGLAARVVSDLNSMKRRVIAIDLPSGMSADRDRLIGPTMTASLTVTLAAPKIPLVSSSTEAAVGDLVVADIGIPSRVIDELGPPHVSVLERSDVSSLIRPRAREAHKTDFGRVLIVAGSRGKTGAAVLAASAALRSGAGLVTIATPSSCLPIVASLGVEFMTEPLAETPDGKVASASADYVLGLPADLLALGPGLGRSASVTAFLRMILERATVPLILDADAISAFAGHADALRPRNDRAMIITPHPGEMARLLGKTVDEVQANRLDTARDLATSLGIYVVLKGHRTVIAMPSGACFINSTGNPGMATGGTGDVLTGMIAAWLGQLKDPEAACKLSVYLHGVAGDLAAASHGEVAMIAGDLVNELGHAVRVLTSHATAARPQL